MFCNFDNEFNVNKEIDFIIFFLFDVRIYVLYFVNLSLAFRIVEIFSKLQSLLVYKSL